VKIGLTYDLRSEYLAEGFGEEETEPGLIREEFVWRPGLEEDELLSRQTLLPITEGGFAFGAVDANDQPAWVTTWDRTRPGLPRLVRLIGTVPVPGGGQSISLNRVVRHPAGIVPRAENP